MITTKIVAPANQAEKLVVTGITSRMLKLKKAKTAVSSPKRIRPKINIPAQSAVKKISIAGLSPGKMTIPISSNQPAVVASQSLRRMSESSKITKRALRETKGACSKPWATKLNCARSPDPQENAEHDVASHERIADLARDQSFPRDDPVGPASSDEWLEGQINDP